MAKGTGKIIRIISCGVFAPALEHFRLEDRYPNLRLTFLPSNLHLKPGGLEKRLLEEVTSAQEREERVICLYGNCFPGIDKFCQDHGITRVTGHYCHEILLGPERFFHILDETAGTYFAEKELICNFDEYCLIPLELEDEELREFYFKHYSKLHYVRQPSDPDLILQAGELAEFLNLSVEVSDADYSHLEKQLIELIE